LRGRRLIVNADDFGQTPGINAGIIKAHREGIVTSASLMVRWPAAAEAAEYTQQNPEFSVGLHADLGEWAAEKGGWRPRYRVVDDEDLAAVDRELRDQLEQFRKLTGRDPTHLDGHQHIQRSGQPRQVLESLATELGVVLRGHSDLVSYVGDFYGRTARDPYPEGITVDRLVDILTGLPPGWSELGCHPGLRDDVESDYLEERSREVETLCHPRVRNAIDALGIELGSFLSVRAAHPTRSSSDRSSSWVQPDQPVGS
jgi:predicted glycoside hydrolase/deacetylase ChbG (UPF0249 family)